MELWRAIPGFEGHYEVSNLGVVRGVDRWVEINGGRKLVPGQVLKAEVQKRDKHLRVPLSKDGVAKKFFVHRLVLLAFVGDPSPGQEALHGNGIPSDNRLLNLKWGTRKENSEDAIRHGKHHLKSKTHCVRNHPLIDSNLDKTSLSKHGKRRCVSCARARALLVHRGELNDAKLQALSDEYFNKIKKEMFVIG